jgi:hypothetical protein
VLFHARYRYSRLMTVGGRVFISFVSIASFVIRHSFSATLSTILY